MKNKTLKEIGIKLKEAESIALFPHVNPDGDALGSCTALCRAFRHMGKKAVVVLDEEIPANLRFLDKGYCMGPQEAGKALAATDAGSAAVNAPAASAATGANDAASVGGPQAVPGAAPAADSAAMSAAPAGEFAPDVCMCVDCSTPDRLESRADAFGKGRFSVCIDHHLTERPFCDMNYVDPGEAATGQIVFDLLKEMGAAPDKEIGEAIFAAITTDTGDFQYTNTQKKSHLIAAELFDWGIDAGKVSVELYENVGIEKIKLKSRAMGTLKLLEDGLGAMVVVTEAMLRETGASMDEAEGLSQDIRSIAGVEYAAVVKEYGPERAKVSLRAKSRGDVAAIAAKFGGGGHIKAAGCTIERPVSEAASMVEAEMLLAIKRLKENDRKRNF